MFIRLSSLLAFALLLFTTVLGQNFPADPAAKLLPDKLGDYKAANPPTWRRKEFLENGTDRTQITSAANRNYVSKDGRRFSATIITAIADSGAYALFTEAKLKTEGPGNEYVTRNPGIGTSSFARWNGLANNLSFFKGRVYASLHDEGEVRDPQSLANFAKTLAETLDKGAGE